MECSVTQGTSGGLLLSRSARRARPVVQQFARTVTAVLPSRAARSSVLAPADTLSDMHFPGEDYLVYLQDPTRTDAPMALEAGLTRFLFTSWREARMMARAAAATYVNFTHARVPFELVYARDGEADRWVFDADGATVSRTTHPVWRLGVDDILTLQILDSESDLIFVENRLNLGVFKQPRHIRYALREIWEYLGDPGRAAKVVIYGYFAREILYASGADGGAVPVRDKMGYRTTRIYGPRSELHYYPHRYDWSQEDVAVGSQFADSPEYVAMKFLQQIPIAFRDTYANGIERLNIGRRDTDRGADPTEYLVNPTEGVKLRFLEGDRRLCDSCSVKYACRLYRERSVCIMPGSEGKRLADFFDTENPKDIIEGMATIIRYQANRFELMVEDEENFIESQKKAGKEYVKRDPEINKVANDLQKNAERLAKLVNPMLTRPQVAIQVNQSGGGSVEMKQVEASPRERAAAARELEAKGIDRSELTPQMILDHIAGRDGRVLEGEVVNGVRNDF